MNVQQTIKDMTIHDIHRKAKKYTKSVNEKLKEMNWSKIIGG